MSEKLTESITHKCTYDERLDLEAIAKFEKVSLSELIRYCCMVRISKERERLDLLSRLMRHTTDTVVTHKFELEAEQVPKEQVQKKPDCRNQLSFFCHSTQKH